MVKKGRDESDLIDKISEDRLALVPNRFLIIQTQGRIDEPTGTLYSETFYILKSSYESSVGVQLPKYLVSIDYLGIQYPSGRIEVKKVRSVQIDYAHNQYIFWLKKGE